jgi:DNA (cytosine-5)-methyltransferase 1
MTHGSLFSGIGGFDLAAEWMGWENKFHCEWNPFGQKILKHYWPNAESFNDITKTDFTPYANRIDVLTGGFPCQPYSTAGKRKGKDDERHLWPEMLRAIREIQPDWVVGENVRGIINWSNGMVFNEIQTDLEVSGYEVFPFLLPACGVNAPHERYRTWFIAYSAKFRQQKRVFESRIHSSEKYGEPARFSDSGDVAHAECARRPQISNIIPRGFSKGDLADTTFKQNDWATWPTQPPICNGDDGIPRKMDGITFPNWRAESVKGGGNAIVPQLAFKIFQAIEDYQKTA